MRNIKKYLLIARVGWCYSNQFFLWLARPEVLLHGKLHGKFSCQVPCILWSCRNGSGRRGYGFLFSKSMCNAAPTAKSRAIYSIVLYITLGNLFASYLEVRQVARNIASYKEEKLDLWPALESAGLHDRACMTNVPMSKTSLNFIDTLHGRIKVRTKITHR